MAILLPISNSARILISSIIPISCVLVAIAGILMIVGVGMLVDAYSYGVAKDWTGSLAEWAGFTIIVIVVFWIPRESNKNITC